jgi:hypothetical protein
VLGSIREILDARVEVAVAGDAAEGRVRPGVLVAQVALAERGVEEDLLPAQRHRVPQRERELEIALPAERELERLERVELRVRRQAEVDPRDAVERLREVLDHRPHREGSQRAVSGRAVARPARARAVRARDRGAQRQGVRHPAHHEPVRQVVEAVEVLQDQPEAPHERRILEALGEGGLGLGDEERVVGRERGDEARVDREVVLGAMAGAAGAAVAGEGLLEEDLLAARDELRLRIGRDVPLAGGQEQRDRTRSQALDSPHRPPVGAARRPLGDARHRCLERANRKILHL